MCGRFTLTASGEEVAEAFEPGEVEALPPRYNIAPSQPVSVVRTGPDRVRRLSTLAWGLRAPGGLPGDRPFINARAETAAERPSFRDAFAERRCLVAASGFYEWEGTGKKRQPWYSAARGRTAVRHRRALGASLRPGRRPERAPS